ncbi:MAG TPA: hypothetical protein VMT15_02155 [Bryobacteraceae bacterium]|nr:hypothetical protein [Bryobacteraceae bacterium]
MRHILLFTACAGALVLAGDGTTPRNSAADYPAHQETKTAVIAAARVPPEQLNRTFPSDLAKKYAVIEVAIYPKDGPAMQVEARDFSLRVSDGIVHPETAQEVAEMWRPHDKPSSLPRNAHVTTEAGIATETHTDPATGRRVTNVGTYQSASVSNDPRTAPPPPTSGIDADRMEARLKTLALPEGKTASPVAGYLFFPLPAKMKKGALEVQYAREDATATLTLPAK